MTKEEIFLEYYSRVPKVEVTDDNLKNINTIRYLCCMGIDWAINMDNYWYHDVESLVSACKLYIKLHSRELGIKKRLTAKQDSIIESIVQEEYDAIKYYTKLLANLSIEEGKVEKTDPKLIKEYIVYTLEFVPTNIFKIEQIEELVK